VLQVENVAARSAGTNSDGRKMILVDKQIISIRLMHDEEDFIQAVNVQLRCLYTQEQINDIRLFCSSNTAPALRSVLSFDRTFNLSSLYLTVTVFKHKKVVRKSMQEPPVFVGPMLLHGDGKYATYLNFFSTVHGALNSAGVSASEF